MKRLSILLFIITLISGAAFGQAPKHFYGLASWYGEELAGKKTASGQTFDPNGLTAAHKNLPFGTMVEIESLENGNKVQVMINDRGPVAGSRVIDVSKKAAEMLGHLDSGTFYVKFTVIKEGTGVITNGESVKVIDTTVKETPAETSTEDTEDAAYTEKTAEREVGDTELDLDMSDVELEKEFVTTEPEDDNLEPVNDLDKAVEVDADKNIVDLDDVKSSDKEVEKTITIDVTDTVLDNDKGDNALVVDETRVTPELLLTNDSVIKVEKNEIDKELDIEIESPYDDEIEKQVDDKKNGTKENDIEYVDNKTQPDYNKDAQGYSYAVQVGAFRKEANALKLYDRLLKQDYPVFTTEVFVNGKRYIRVRVGYYGSQDQAKSVQSRIKSMNLPGIIVKTKLQ